ncbi:MAG TPA: nucleotidyltransferase, partial [Blastocatellia bacterium]|nr:nucleotidyltransferase [Blastocatellia bacterium]
LTFVVTGNEVDIVPILYQGDTQWRGFLISQDTGEPMITSVPMHLNFIRERKKRNEKHYAQLVRFMKFWANLRLLANFDDPAASGNPRPSRAISARQCI